MDQIAIVRSDLLLPMQKSCRTVVIIVDTVNEFPLYVPNSILCAIIY